ncbi:MAG: FG-GAP-like repeat-containing protein, partial [Candidatus Glassbacteria bacterium]
VSEIKTVRARNYSAPDSTELDTLADIEFIPELNAPLARDTVPPFIYFATQYPTTTNNAGPYPITASVVDNYTVNVKLLWGTKANIFADTLAMLPVADQLKDDYLANIPGQPFNTIVSYFILARDGADRVSSKPDSIHSNPFVPPYLFEVLSNISDIVPNLGITLTTDATNTVNSLLPVRIDTWITSNIKIFSVLLKWRNVNESSTYSDIPLNRFGAHYWGEIPPRPPGSRIEYFVQVADTTGRPEKDPRAAPNKIFDYEVLTNGALGPVSFADTTSRLGLPIARSSRYSTIADFNEDGILDVVIANYGEANEVYFYNRAIGFEDVSLNVLGPQSAEKTTFVAVADFNADDHLDLIFANEDSQNRLYINNGRGRFDDKTFALVDTTGRTYLPADNWGTRCILADDFDGNGTIDLFLANFKIGGERNRLLLNDGKGIFTDATTTKIFNMPDRDQSVWAVKGDLDKDGDVDIIVINQPDKPYLLINSGNGTLQYRAWSATAGNYARGGDLGDIDSDGDLDLVIFQSQTTHNELYINDGKGNFTLDRAGRLPSESDETYGGKFFDANADGYLDLYYANFGQPNRLLINQNGSGTFVEATPGIMPAWSGFSRGVAVGDFNNDNRVDLYVTEEQAQNRIIFSRSFDTSGDLPVAFDLVFPVNADTVNSTEVTFVWKNSTSPDTNDVLRYDFVLSLDSLFSFNSTVEGFPKENLSDTTLTVTGLNDRTRYWWKVFVHGRSGYPISSLQSHSFLLDTSHQGAGPEFYVLVSRNPAFAGHITVYIVSSEPLRSDPVVKFNLDQVPVVRVGTNDIWRAHYVTRNSFLLSITGENRSGRSGEYTKTFASVSLLASAGPGQQAPTPDRMAWVTLGPGSSAGAVRLVTSVNEQVTNAKIKEQLNRLDPFGGLDVNLVVGTDSYTFTLEEGSLTGEVTVNIRSRGNEDGPQAIYLLTEYGWQELDTRFDAGAGVYSAGTDQLGTFALRPAAGGPGLPKAGEFGLGQNSPNPFNPSTTIVYAIPGDTPLAGFSIKVYNLRGALVKVLVEGSVTPGRHSVQWDGRSVDGRDLPSGVYFYRMAAPGRTITRKMVLLR